MSDHNGWWFVDLVLVATFAGVTAGGIYLGTPGPARIVLAMALFLLLPGYALVAIIFPEAARDEGDDSFDDDRSGLWNPQSEKDGIDRIVRFVLSVVLSVALAPVVALAANLTPRGVTLQPLIAGLAVLTVVFCLLALLRRWRCSTDLRFAPAFGAFWSGLFYSSTTRQFSGSNPSNVAYNVAIGLSLLLLVSSVGYAVANPPQHEGFTELNVDTGPVTGDDQSMYQSTYARGESQEFAVNITNREHREIRYTTVVLLQRVNRSDGGTTVRDANELARGALTVSDGATERRAFEIAPTMAGDNLRLLVLLYEGDAPGDPSAENAYRVLRLPVTVDEEGNSLAPVAGDGGAPTILAPSGGR